MELKHKHAAKNVTQMIQEIFRFEKMIWGTAMSRIWYKGEQWNNIWNH